jgi:hypothetical protein
MGKQGFNQDAYGYGISNGIVYALGISPTGASATTILGKLPKYAATGTGATRKLAMTLDLPTGAPADVRYDVQVSDNLKTWTGILEKNGTGAWTVVNASGATIGSSVSGAGRTVQTITDNQSHKFMRLSVTQGATAPTSTFATWAAAMPAGKQGFNQDAYGYGVSNGIEYALGISATGSSSATILGSLPKYAATGTGATRKLAMTLNLPTGAPADVRYDVQVSDNLTTWTNILEKAGAGDWTVVNASGATVGSAAGGTGRTVFTITDNQAHKFMRLSVTQAP